MHLRNLSYLVSAVYFEGEKYIIVDSEALICATIDSGHVVSFVKKWQLMLPSFFAYGIYYTYAEICALIFKELKNIAELNGYEIEDIALCYQRKVESL